MHLCVLEGVVHEAIFGGCKMIGDWSKGYCFDNETFLIQKLEVRQTKAGKDFWSMSIGDASGSIPAKIWDTLGVPSLSVGDVISAKGEVTEYQGELQVTLQPASVCVIPDANKFDYCRRTKYKVDSMWQAVCSLIESIEDPWCQKLLQVFLSDEEFVQKFTSSSAAVSIHHDFVGGLLEHTLFIMRMCNQACGVYKQLNRDLLLTTAFLHDVGKLNEIAPFPENTYTPYGNLIGHVAGSAMIVDKACDRVKDFPKDTRLKIVHCLLAHHGQLEWGSPKLPGIPEALVLSMLDNMDAKLKVFEEALVKEDFSTYNRILGVYPAKGDFSE